MSTAILIACFTADVTPPIGHPLCGGLVKSAERIVDPLYAKGFVLLGAGKPVVLCAVDWCEIHNDAFDRWRRVLADAAGTVPARVMVCTIHQHDAPIADLGAAQMLQRCGAPGAICDPDFHEASVQRTARAIRKALKSPRKVTHVGLGQAKVEKVASNRRILGSDGKVHKMRGSSCTDPELIAAPEGTIDPWLKTISFWDGDAPVAALSCYATHPMSYYRTGGVSSDFYGLARARRQSDDPAVVQIMTNGCAGNLGAGKYNDGSPRMRTILTDRLYQAMVGAWKGSKRHPVSRIEYRTTPLKLPLKTDPRFGEKYLTKLVADGGKPLPERVRAALALSWVTRAKAGRAIDVPVLDLGVAQILLLPGEPFVEYQLAAQKMRPDLFVMVIGLGSLGPGYVPVDEAYGQGGYEPGDWCFVGPGTEHEMKIALSRALKAQ